jgi:hypothetical protein
MLGDGEAGDVAGFHQDGVASLLAVKAPAIAQEGFWSAPQKWCHLI